MQKKLAAEYSQKYRSSPIDNDTYKSQTEMTLGYRSTNTAISARMILIK